MTTALTLPEGTALEAMYRAENGVDPLISRIEDMVRSHVAEWNRIRCIHVREVLE